MSQFKHRFKTSLVIIFVFSLSSFSIGSEPVSHGSKSNSAPATAVQPFPFNIAVYGNFAQMMKAGDYSPKVKLGDVLSGNGLYALGALSGLRGEITVINGKSYVSLGSPSSSRLVQGNGSNEEATLLVTAKATDWTKITTPNDMNQTDFETFVIQSAKKAGIDVSKPFPFMLEGGITDYKIHVLAAPNPSGGGHGHGGTHGGNKGGAIQFNSSGKLLEGQVVGFYSGQELSGVISHPGEFFHVHMVDAKETISAHIDSYSVPKDANLLIPTQGANVSRQAMVASRGAEVMPFSLDATTHVFRKTKIGGTQQVIAKSASDAEQIRLIRKHLREIEGHFTSGNFAGPVAIHGESMPGLSVLKTAKSGEVKIRYVELPNGAELQYSSTKPPLIKALHQWFDAQLSDHGKDAMSGHKHAH